MVVPRVVPRDPVQMPVQTISCFCWSPDHRKLALCPGSSEIQIYLVTSSGSGSNSLSFELIQKLNAHEDLVTGLDWSIHGQLVSVSEDRVAFVWHTTKWTPSEVELAAPRGASHVAWNSAGTKFAVSTSSQHEKKCHIGMWNGDAKIWQARKIGKHRAALTSSAWHPSGHVIALMSLDCTVTVHSVYLKGYDAPCDPVHFQGKNACEAAFGSILHRISLTAWCLHGAFSPDGSSLAVCSQDGCVRIDKYVFPHQSIFHSFNGSSN